MLSIVSFRHESVDRSEVSRDPHKSDWVLVPLRLFQILLFMTEGNCTIDQPTWL